MGDTSIEWTDKSWNPIRARNTKTGKIGWHCEPVTAGCAFCYAEEINQHRFGTGLPYKPGHLKNGDVEIFIDERMEVEPLKWRKPQKVFPCSMTDMFGDFVHTDIILRMLWVMMVTPHLTYQIVTKRPRRMCSMFRQMGDNWEKARSERMDLTNAHTGGKPAYMKIAEEATWPLPNVWAGTSTEDQQAFDERVPWLEETPAAVRFISLEPMLGPVRVRGIFGDRPNLDWVIVGCESGRSAREPEGLLGMMGDVVDDCRRQGIACFIKQIPGAVRGKPIKTIEDFPEALRVRQWPEQAR
jgi:protein gp37